MGHTATQEEFHAADSGPVCSRRRPRIRFVYYGVYCWFRASRRWEFTVSKYDIIFR